MESRFFNSDSVTESKAANSSSSTATPIPNFSDDPTLTAFKKFYATPIVDVILEFLNGKFDDEKFIIRMQHLTANEKKTIQEWTKCYLERFDARLPSVRLFKTLVFDFELEFENIKNRAEINKSLKKAVEAGSVIAIALLGFIETDPVLKTEYLNEAVKKGDKYSHYLLGQQMFSTGNLRAALQHAIEGIKAHSIFAHYGFVEFSIGIEEGRSEDVQARLIEVMKTAAANGLAAALVRLADCKYTGFLGVTENYLQSAHYYHHALMRMKNEYQLLTLPNKKGTITTILNYPVQLFKEGLDNLYINYQLAYAIDQIKGDEDAIITMRAFFKKRFNQMIKDDVATFEKLYSADEFEESKQAVRSWLDKPLLVLLSFKYDLAFKGLSPHLPPEIIYYIMDFAIGKMFIDFLNTELSSEDKMLDKAAQIKLHFFRRAASKGMHGFFKIAGSYELNANQNLEKNFEKTNLGKITHEEALQESTQIKFKST